MSVIDWGRVCQDEEERRARVYEDTQRKKAERAEYAAHFAQVLREKASTETDAAKRLGLYDAAAILDTERDA